MRNEIGAANHDPNILASWRGKNPGRLLRTALTLEFLEWAAQDSNDPEPNLVSLAAMKRAADYIDYCDAMMHRCLGLLAVPPEEILLAQTARLILAEKFSAIGERELYRRPGFSALRNNDRRNRIALALMSAARISAFIAQYPERTGRFSSVSAKAWLRV
jgi:hypothetical protein